MLTPTSKDSPALHIVGAAQSAGKFATFLMAAKSVGLTETLKRDGPFTLFAPTDKAFEQVPSSTLTKLRLPEHEALLRAVLLFHIAPGQVRAGRFAGSRIRAVSLQGGKLLIDGSDGIVVSGARVIAPDILASNGVIHGIDRVLWPKHALAEPVAAPET